LGKDPSLTKKNLILKDFNLICLSAKCRKSFFPNYFDPQISNDHTDVIGHWSSEAIKLLAPSGPDGPALV
jgi:hypothetical protein